MKKLILCLALVTAMTSLVSAQNLRTATLVGNVTDSSGAVIANAAVTVTNVDTNVATRSKTNEDGAYYVPFLNIGNYQLTVESPGFKKFDQTRPHLQCRRDAAYRRETPGGRRFRGDKGDRPGRPSLYR